MSEPLRPDLFKVSFGSVPEGLYVLEIDLPLKAKVLPKLVLDDFSGSSVVFLSALKSEEGFHFTLPVISRNFKQTRSSVCPVASHSSTLRRFLDYSTLLTRNLCRHPFTYLQTAEYLAHKPLYQSSSPILGRGSWCLAFRYMRPMPAFMTP